MHGSNLFIPHWLQNAPQMSQMHSYSNQQPGKPACRSLQYGRSVGVQKFSAACSVKLYDQNDCNHGTTQQQEKHTLWIKMHVSPSGPRLEPQGPARNHTASILKIIASVYVHATSKMVDKVERRADDGRV